MACVNKLLHIFASKSWGGGEQYVYDLAMRQKSEGCEVVVVSRNSQAVLSKIKDKGFVIYKLSLSGLFDIVSILRLALVMRKERPDIVHAHHFKDAFQAVLARLFAGVSCRVVCTRHIVKRGKSNILYNWLYSKLDKIVFVSHLAKDAFLWGGVSVDHKKIYTIHSGITPCLSSSPVDLRKEYNISDGDLLLLYSGRIVEEKGCHVLFEACSQIADRPFVLFMAGSFASEEYKKRLEDIVVNSSIAKRIIYLGFVDNVRALLPQVDICVIPTIAPEAFGLSVAEAMIAGCAVVTTDNGAQKEFLDNRVNGILVPPSDSKALAAALSLLIDDDDTRRSIGEKARGVATLLSYEKFYSSYKEVYEQ